MRIGLASPHFPASAADAVRRVTTFIADAAAARVDLVAFPECYIPGMRGLGFPVAPFDQAEQEAALEAVRAAAGAHGVAVILPMEWRPVELTSGVQNVAFVISASGEVLGHQTKNQIPLEEEGRYEGGSTRRVFDVAGVTIGIAICHEGWRYPETVRWAAARGAKIVFHPHFVGGAAPAASEGRVPPRDPFYEKAMAVRGGENSIYFASVNFALPWQETATTLIGPSGEVIGSAPEGDESLLIRDIDLDLATGILAARYQPDRYQEAAAEI